MEREEIFSKVDDNKDKRLYLRYPYCYKIRKCIPNVSYELKGFTTNISFGGMQFKTNQKFSKGDYFEVIIDHPQTGEFWLKFKACVAWVKEINASDNLYLIGVQLEEDPSKQYEFIYCR